MTTLFPTIESFQGEYRFLSNFWPAEVMWDGKCFPSVENAYQAAKFLDIEGLRDPFMTCTPGQAKRLGKTAEPTPHWYQDRVRVMYNLVLQKFCFHKDLKLKLLNTGDMIIVEGNTWGDTFWGVCDGQGQNTLGNILMRVREVIKANERANPDS